MRILNLGCGKIDLSRFDKIPNAFIVNVDRYFKGGYVDVYGVELAYKEYTVNLKRDIVFCKSDIFEFLDTFKYKFDLVIAERIFEHMEYVSGEIGRLLEAINTATYPKAELEIVVPNSIHLANMILNYEKMSNQYDHIKSINEKLIINTEFCNIRADPHLSVWTPTLAAEYIQSEGTWNIASIINQFNFAGRSIYMKILCKKVQNAEINKKQE